MTERAPVEVIIIGGTAVQTKAYPTLCHVGKWFVDHHSETHFIDGAAMVDDELVTLSPAQQTKAIRELVPDLDNPKKRFLYVTHCLGMAAGHRADGARLRKLYDGCSFACTPNAFFNYKPAPFLEEHHRSWHA